MYLLSITVILSGAKDLPGNNEEMIPSATFCTSNPNSCAGESVPLLFVWLGNLDLLEGYRIRASAAQIGG